jgi:hypothetical protein
VEFELSPPLLSVNATLDLMSAEATYIAVHSVTLQSCIYIYANIIPHLKMAAVEYTYVCLCDTEMFT